MEIARGARLKHFFFSKLKKRKWPSVDLIRFASFSWSVYTKSGRRLSCCSWFPCRNSFRMPEPMFFKKIRHPTASPAPKLQSRLTQLQSWLLRSSRALHKPVSRADYRRVFDKTRDFCIRHQRMPPSSPRPVCSSTFSRLETKSDTFSFTHHISIRNWMISLDNGKPQASPLSKGCVVGNRTDGVCIVASDIGAAGESLKLSVCLQKSVSTTANGNKTNEMIKIFLAVSFFADAAPPSPFFIRQLLTYTSSIVFSQAPANRAWKKIFHFFRKAHVACTLETPASDRRNATNALYSYFSNFFF